MIIPSEPEPPLRRESDERTNRMLAEYPVHCELRTVPLGQRVLHAHDGYEFYLLLRGFGSYIVGDRLYPLHAGTLTVVRPRAFHRPYSSDGQPFHRYVLSMRESYLEGMDALCPSLADGIADRLVEPAADGGHFFLSVPQLARMQTIMAELERGLKMREASFELSVLRGMAELLLFIAELREQPEAEGMRGTENERLIGAVLSHLVAHYQEELRIDDLVRLFPVSRSRLLSSFKEKTGYTIVQFLTEYRIGQAKMLLTGTALPVTDVASRCGFGDLSHFFGVFKRQTGWTPLQYRSQAAGARGRHRG